MALSLLAAALSAGPGSSWLLDPVSVSLELDPLHSLGEVADEGQGGAEGVDAEAFVVPDWAYSGRAWAYSRAGGGGGGGGRIVGRVVLQAARGQRVWHEGLQLQLQQYLHLMDPYIQSEQASVSQPLLPPGGGWISDVPMVVPFEILLAGGAGGGGGGGGRWADTYNGCAFGVRHMLRASLSRPWYTFDCCAYAVPWLYSVGPGHAASRCSQPVLNAYDTTDGQNVVCVGGGGGGGGGGALSPEAGPMETETEMEVFLLVPERLAPADSATPAAAATPAATAAAIPAAAAAAPRRCTRCSLRAASDRLSCSGTLELTLAFHSVVVDSNNNSSSSYSNSNSDSKNSSSDSDSNNININSSSSSRRAGGPFVDIMLAQLVLIKGEFSGEFCLHMSQLLVHTVVGADDGGVEEALGDATAMSRGYSSRR
jgi:hypothetical protein